MVAPILESIPYILIFSVVEIANEFLIQNTLVNKIIITTTAITLYSIVRVVSLKANTSHLSNSWLIAETSYFIGVLFSSTILILDTPNICGIDVSYSFGSFKAIYPSSFPLGVLVSPVVITEYPTSL